MSRMDPGAAGFSHSPFMRFLGLEIIKAEKGRVEIRLPFREEFVRVDGSDWLHGGVVSALADIAGDYAVMSETARRRAHHRHAGGLPAAGAHRRPDRGGRRRCGWARR